MSKFFKLTRNKELPKFLDGFRIDEHTKLCIHFLQPLPKPNIPLKFFSKVHAPKDIPYEVVTENNSESSQE